MIDLTPGAAKGAATWINDCGDVTGYGCAELVVCHGFLWRHGKLTHLPVVGAGVGWADTQSINSLDQIVGDETNSNDQPLIAALWANGRVYNLNNSSRHRRCE
jgi:hypothetical protein